jgi:hypothetical protein
LICPSLQSDNPLEDLENRKKCDQVLMRSFKLEGMKFPHKPEEISICPFVDGNCCTLMDELTILKYWKEFSMEKWKKFSSYIIYLVGNIVNFQPFVLRMGIHNIPFFFTERDNFYYKSYSCSAVEQTHTTKPFTLSRNKLTKKIRNLKLNMLRDVFNNDERKLKEYLKEEKKKEKNHLKNKKNLTPLMIDGFTETQRKRFLKEMTEQEKQAYLNANAIKLKDDESKSKANYRFLRDVRIMSKVIERKLRVAYQHLKNNLYQTLDNYDEFLAKTKVKFKPILEKYQKDVNQYIENGKYYIEQLPQMVKYDFASYKRFMLSIKALMVDNLEAAYKVMEQGGGKEKPEFMMKLLNKIKMDHMPSVLVPEIPDLTMPLPEVDPLVIPKVQCFDTDIPQSRTMLVLNAPKLEYCSNQLIKVNRIKMQDYQSHLYMIKNELMRLIEVKKSLYCVLCDVDQQVLIDKKKNLIVLDRAFCGDYIGNFQEYFRFMNVFFVKYLDAIFQYINCVESEGDELDFPFFTIIEKKKRMAKMWELCFDSINTDDEFKNCYFICSEFKYDRNTPTIEGDLEFLKTVYFEVISFMRKNKLSMVKTVGIPGRKINWKLQNSMIVAKNNPFNADKDHHKIGSYSEKDAIKEVKKWEEDNSRILEAAMPNTSPIKQRKMVKRSPVKCYEDEYLFEKLLHDNENIYQDHSIFTKPTKVDMLRRYPKSYINERLLESQERKLWINPKPLKQGFKPYVDTVRESLDLDKLKEDFHREQLEKMLAKEEPAPVEREVKKDEIFERIEMTVDISNMEMIFINAGEGINPLKMSEGAEFDIDEKKLLQQNMKTFGAEILHRSVLEPTITITNKKIDSFNKDINMKVMNSKNLPHKFKKLMEPDFYELEKEKQKDKIEGNLPPPPDKIDKILDKFENLKIDVSTPDPVTELDETKDKLEKNPRVKSVWDEAKYLGR